MNTEQAFSLLKNAGVTEDVSIQTVRRWLRERKINYEGTGNQKTGYILEDTDQVFELLKDAGIAASRGIQIVQRWLREGRIKSVGNVNQLTEYIRNEKNTTLFSNNPSDQDKTIRQLKAKIKIKDEHIKGIEKLHKSSIDNFIVQRDKLTKEIVNLEKENSKLQRETLELLRENINLRNELLKIKEEISKGSKGDPEKTYSVSTSKPHDYRQKLGLNKTAGHKEILSGYKKLLKITHPDKGGNASAFHYIKTDYDQYRNSLKGE